jgi:hypothetical protein
MYWLQRCFDVSFLSITGGVFTVKATAGDTWEARISTMHYETCQEQV